MGLHLLEVEAHLLLLQVGLPEGREAALDQQAHLGLDAALVRVGLPRDAHQRAHKLADDARRRAAVVASFAARAFFSVPLRLLRRDDDAFCRQSEASYASMAWRRT